MPFHIKGRLAEKEKPPRGWPSPPSDEKDPDEIVRIKVMRKTREMLKRFGIKGDTYEVIIRRLMERRRKEEKK